MKFFPYFLKETWRGRSIYRLLFQWELWKRRNIFEGKEMLHLASGGNSSYGKYIYSDAKKVVRTDYVAKSGVDTILDFNKTFPFQDHSCDVVLLINALYIAEDPNFVLGEIKRVLRPGGQFVLVSPFVANEMPEPHDYVRWTSEGIRTLAIPFFTTIELVSIGERGTSAMYVLQPFLFIWPLRILGYLKGLLLDRMIPNNVKKHHPFPLGYLYVGRK